MFDGDGGDAGASEGASEAASTESVVYGKPEGGAEESQVGADTEPENTPDPKAEFEALITGQYEKEFNSAVQGIMDQRFKNTENFQNTITGYEEATAPLFAMYGLKAGDLEGLKAAIERDEALYSHRADQEGITSQQFRENLRLKMEAAQGRAFQEEMERESQKRQKFEQWDREAAALKAAVPNFDLAMELQNPEFQDSLNRGNSVVQSFYIAHMNEILSGAQTEAQNDATNKFVENFKSRQARPPENAGAATPSVVRKSDPSKWTDEDMDEVEKRVAAGERIML